MTTKIDGIIWERKEDLKELWLYVGGISTWDSWWELACTTEERDSACRLGLLEVDGVGFLDGVAYEYAFDRVSLY